MSIRRWIAGVGCPSLSTGQHAPTFMHMSEDVFIHLCQWLSVRDILALRMSNKSVARVTYSSMIWVALLRKLQVPLPLLPPTAKYFFGKIASETYEWLMVRALYLEQNWRRHNPVPSHSRFEGFDQTVSMKMLPGGKYMVSVAKNVVMEEYALVLWDLDHKGRRLALTGAVMRTPFMKLEAKYGIVEDLPNILIAYSTQPLQTPEGLATKVTVLHVPIAVLEELATHGPDSMSLRNLSSRLERPFAVYHESIVYGEVNQLALGDFEGEMILLIVHRPRAIVFHYLSSGRRGSMILGPIPQHYAYRHSIWTVKLLANQNCVLVSRVLVDPNIPCASSFFTLDLYLIPGPDEAWNNPECIGRHLIENLWIDEFYFSELETSWFTSLRDPAGLIPAAMHNQPPPISIFATTREPRGFVQWLLRPQPIPNDMLHLPYNRGTIQRFIYQFPALKVERNIWDDQDVKAVIIPGAYRSIVAMRPHVHPKLQRAGAAQQGVDIMWFCTHATHRGRKFATPRSTGNVCTRSGRDGCAEEVDEREEGSLAVKREREMGLRQRTLRVPVLPERLALDMRKGTTAIGFDESSGRMCVATTGDTGVHVLDFGGGKWEVPVVKL